MYIFHHSEVLSNIIKFNQIASTENNHWSKNFVETGEVLSNGFLNSLESKWCTGL